MTDAPNKSSYYVLVFTQNGSALYYTNWGSWTDGSNVAEPVESLSVRAPANTGGTDDRDLEIEFSAGQDTTGWLDSLCTGEPAAPVTLILKLGLVPFGPGQTETEELHTIGRYRLVSSNGNARGRLGRNRLRFRDVKGLLNIPLGIAATPRCAWVLGDKNCGYDAEGDEETGTIAEVDKNTITLTNPTDYAVVTSKPTNSWWQRGFATVDGLTIGIRVWEGGDVDKYDFQLVRKPPASWLGATVTLRPGCDKVADTCENVFSNLDKHAPFGHAIPAHHPVTETPS